MENQKRGITVTTLSRDNTPLQLQTSNYANQDILIPLCIYTDKLSGLEIITKFLRENLYLEFKEIAQLLNRSEKTIWQAYDDSRQKSSEFFSANKNNNIRNNKNNYFIPLSIFSNRKLSILESLVKYLKERNYLTLAEISTLLNRDQRTIWTVYNRVKIKDKLVMVH
ncbi:hypothetical protein HZA96_00275 [Candidatus Woesearchaeota archaeon]|nr:hypothetical protein [Candidatus Woesearchaeota archaeon]